jgi:nitrite reductase (NO-forming)
LIEINDWTIDYDAASHPPRALILRERSMWTAMRARLNEWYIAAVGVLLIAGGLFLAPPSRQLPLPRQSRHSIVQRRRLKLSRERHSRPRAQRPHPPPSAAASAPMRQAAMETTAPPPHDQAIAHTMDHGTTTVAQAQPAAAAAPGGGDATAGRLVFRKCQACHSMEPGKTILGPSLAGIIGRKAGSEPGYSYSPAMKQANIVWDAKTLDAYLNDPQKVVPGNKMPFPGLKTDTDRADVLAFFAGAGAAGAAGAAAARPAAATTAQQTPAAANQAAPPANQPAQGTANADSGYLLDAKYTLRSGIAEGRMVYIGVGGAIDGKVNPVLTAAEGQVVQLTLINGEGAEHDIVFPDQSARSPRVTGKSASTTIAFRAEKSGDFVYYCSVPGHREAGMQGQFLVTPRPAPQTLVEADISREPTDLPPPIGKHDPQTVRVDLFAVEVEGRLAEGTTFGYWTFNGKVHPRQSRRHRRHSPEKLARQRDDPFGRFSRHHRTGRRRRSAAGRSREGKIDDVEGAGARALRLSLRDPDGVRAHRQRHVRSDPGRARGGPAAGRPRVLCHAG